MSLAQCPECKREISDTAMSCPHCGFVLKAEQFQFRKSELSSVEKKPVAGVMLIFIGSVTFIGGLFFGPIGWILSIVGGIGAISGGVLCMKGTQKGRCPYCNSPVSVPAKATTFKCQNCKKTSAKKGSFLEAIE